MLVRHLQGTHPTRAFLGAFSSRSTCSFAAGKRPESEPSGVVACSATLQVLTSLTSDPGATAPGSAASGTFTPYCYEHNQD